MNEISCDVCVDLMPIVRDGVASQDSHDAVMRHLEVCPVCRELYVSEASVLPDGKRIMEKARKKTQIFWAMVMMFGLFYGLMLTSGSGIFQNAWIMPVIGGIGYYLFRWKGLYIIPALLLVTHTLTNWLGLGGEILDLPSLLLWSAIYCGAAVVGLVIAGLLHFAFRKEER